MTRTLFISLLLSQLGLLSIPAFAEIIIAHPYVRATPPGVTTSAAFMHIKNDAASSLSLVSATTQQASKVELHTMVQEGDIMMMRQVDAIDLPGNGEVMLKPGGLHVMLFGLEKPLVEGDSLKLELQFSDGSSQQISAPIKKVAAGMQHHKHQH
ncbi:copper chaperone PCu(A)C [Aliagarivorans marinus]|uniref:copper chaperone PCu(A)C n=1 Tax=Aliagarivorans marinus TaxID=561965 RepID=UPI0003FA1BBC|nr:copper chaperone PCu(A)C [Aliagarivorans marinus]